MSPRNPIETNRQTLEKTEKGSLTGGRADAAATDRLRADAREAPSDKSKALTNQPPEAKPEPFKEYKLTIADSVSDAERNDGVVRSFHGQYPGSTKECKYGLNADGKFVRFEDTQNRVCRDLSREDLIALNKPGEQPGWKLMGENGPQRLKYDDIRFFPPDGKGGGGIFVARYSDTVACAWGQDGIRHQGRINASGAFVESDQQGHATWIIHADGSQMRGEYANNQLKSFTETNAQGESFAFTQDSLNSRKHVRMDDTGKVVEERYNTVLDTSGTYYSDDIHGVSTIVFSDGTVEHGHIMFGNAQDALNYRTYRKTPKAVHLQPPTYPTFCVDRSQGRTTAILAPEIGGKDGCNDSPKGGVDRTFAYIGDTNKLNDVTEIASKGDFADVVYHSTRHGESDKWTVQEPKLTEVKVYTFKKDEQGNVQHDYWRRPILDRDEEGKPILKTEKRTAYTNFEYNGPIDFKPGSRDLAWKEPIVRGKPETLDIVNHPDGSVERMHQQGNVDRYLTKDLTTVGIQHRDAATGKPIGPKYIQADFPGAVLGLNGSVKYTDKEGNQHQVNPNHTELVLNPSNQTYVMKDSKGRDVQSGPLVRSNPADRTLQIDPNNGQKFTYLDDFKVQVVKTINGKEQEPETLVGDVSEGELWHQGPAGTTLVEQPDLITRSIESDRTSTYSFSNDEITVQRKVSDGHIGDTVKNKAGAVIQTDLKTMEPEMAAALGLNPAYRYSYLTRSQQMPGQQPVVLIPPPTAPKAGEAPKPIQTPIFINVETLANGAVQATSLQSQSHEQIRFNVPKTPQDLLQPTVISTFSHLANSKEKFDQLVAKDRQQVEQMIQQGTVFLPPDLINTKDPNWSANWARQHYGIQLNPTGRPLMPAELAFNYDCAIAAMSAGQNQSTTPPGQPGFVPRPTVAAGTTAGTWSDAFKQLEQQRAQGQAEAEKKKDDAAPRRSGWLWQWLLSP